MWVRLLQSHTLNTGKKLPIGRVFNVISSEARRLISEGIAMSYDGKFPPDKMKTDFFKPKKNKRKWQQQEQ